VAQLTQVAFEEVPHGELPSSEQYLTANAVSEWRSLIGDEVGDGVPFEFALTWMLDALRKALDGIPEGGVLLRHELSLFSAAPLDQKLKSRVEVAEKYHRRGRPVIAFRINTTTRADTNVPIAQDVIHLLWPRAHNPAAETSSRVSERRPVAGRRHETRVNREVMPSVRGEITQAQIDRYARLSGDFNPLHVDPEAGRRSAFRSTIAHGPIPLGYLARALRWAAGTDWPTGTRIDARFVAPSRPGDLLHVREQGCELTVYGQDDAVRIVADVTASAGEQ